MTGTVVFAKFCKACHCVTERNAKGECRPCTKAYMAAYRFANKEKLKANQAAKYRANIEKIKADRAAYHAANREKTKARLRDNPAQIERNKALHQKWKLANQDRLKESRAAYHAANLAAFRVYAHNRRARKRANRGALSKDLAEKLFILQRGKCPCCAQPLGKDYHLDHKMPLALGGPNTDENMQLLRKQCNLRKRDLHPVDFMQKKGFLL